MSKNFVRVYFSINAEKFYGDELHLTDHDADDDIDIGVSYETSDHVKALENAMLDYDISKYDAFDWQYEDKFRDPEEI